MSMIGNTLLNEIVNSKKILETDKIVNELNKNIKIALRQEKSGNMDGMDLCFCRFKFKELGCEIQFTGAKNNLYYIKNNENKVQRLKADRNSIGGISKKRRKIEFTAQKITLHKNDLLYLSTDGFIDQNNQHRKKIGTAKFLSILEEIQFKDMKTQKEILLSKLQEHQQDEEQRDDITLVGIKL